jgi:predicted nucleotidyltransferase
MVTNIDHIILKASERFPGFLDVFKSCEKDSSEAVLFGSYATGCENLNSDIDILFVGNNKHKSSRFFDFVWIKKERLESKTWLSSELAIHIAKYGQWLKGSGSWRNQVFFSPAALISKKQRIFERLVHIYLQKDKLSLTKKKVLIQKIILNTLRLKNLRNKIPNPPTCITVSENKNLNDLYNEMFEPQLLGAVGRVFFEEIFPEQNINEILLASFEELIKTYQM